MIEDVLVSTAAVFLDVLNPFSGICGTSSSYFTLLAKLWGKERKINASHLFMVNEF